MAQAIHHQTQKSAAKHGLTIVEKLGSFEVRTLESDFLVDAAKDPKAALQGAIAVIMEDAEAGAEYDECLQAWVDNYEPEVENDDESDAEQDKSIVKRKYKKAYKPFHNSCGDDFAELMDKAIKVKQNVDGKTVYRVDEVKLMKLAKANDVWKESYKALNVGSRRMSIGVRMRKLIKDGEKIIW